jgi:hypothetical protein
MWLATLRNLVFGPRSLRRPARQRRRAPLLLERLEDRTLPSAYTAGSVADLIADINAANAAGGSNTIALVAGTSFVLSAVNNTTDGATGLPVIAANDNLGIAGNGDTIARSTATGTPAFRLLDVAGGAALALSNVTLEGGLAFGSGVSAEGGAIYTQGTLLLSGLTVQNNIVQGSAAVDFSPGQPAAGGGLYSSGSLTLQGCTVQNNQALGGPAGLHLSGLASHGAGSGAGGGLYSSGSLTLQSSSIQNNQAVGGQGPYFGLAGDGLGGGLYVAGGTASLSNVTLYSNTAQGGAGGDGILIRDFDSGKYIPTPGGNGGNGFGGGLYVAGGTVSVSSTSVEHNTAAGGTGGKGARSAPNGIPGLGEGGGLYIDPAASVCLDAFTQAHVKSNRASTAYPDIDGSYTTCP